MYLADRASLLDGDCGTNMARMRQSASAEAPRTRGRSTARGSRNWRWPMSRGSPPARRKLERYLRRKLRERGWDGRGRAGRLAALVERFVARGYVDDAAYARAQERRACCGAATARGGSTRRWARRASPRKLRDEVRAGRGGRAARGAGAGPQAPASARSATAPPDRAAREKQIAAMLRAGHPLDSARELVDAASVEAAEEWARRGGDEEEEEPIDAVAMRCDRAGAGAGGLLAAAGGRAPPRRARRKRRSTRSRACRSSR